MRLSRFFTDTPLSLGDHELPEAQAHYISRVLRMNEGDAVQLFDGSGQEFRGSLLEVGKKRDSLISVLCKYCVCCYAAGATAYCRSRLAGDGGQR